MKARTLTSITAASLLAAALLSLGIRHLVDQRRAGDVRTSGNTQGMASATAANDRGGPRPSLENKPATDHPARMKKLRTLLITANLLDRERALLAFIAGLKAEDFQPVLDDLLKLSLSPNAHHALYRRFVSAWAELDPPAAILWEEKFGRENGLGDNTGLSTVALGTWLRRDPAAARAWVDANPDSGSRHYLTTAEKDNATDDQGRALAKLALKTPEEIVHDLRDASDEDRTLAMSHLGDVMALRGWDDLRQWLATLGDPGLRKKAVSHLLEDRLALTGEKRLDLYRLYPESAGKDFIDGALNGLLAQQDPAAALAAFQSQPDGPRRQEVAGRMISTLTSYPANPELALKLMDLCPEAATDFRLMAWMQSGQSSDTPPPPSYFLEQLPRIKDDAKRQQSCRKLLTDWLRTDAPAAREWLEHHEVPAEVRESLEGL